MEMNFSHVFTFSLCKGLNAKPGPLPRLGHGRVCPLVDRLWAQVFLVTSSVSVLFLVSFCRIFCRTTLSHHTFTPHFHHIFCRIFRRFHISNGTPHTFWGLWPFMVSRTCLTLGTSLDATQFIFPGLQFHAHENKNYTICFIANTTPKNIKQDIFHPPL